VASGVGIGVCCFGDAAGVVAAGVRVCVTGGEAGLSGGVSWVTVGLTGVTAGAFCGGAVRFGDATTGGAGAGGAGGVLLNVMFATGAFTDDGNATRSFWLA
jgi:hypothetical protein